MKRCPACRKRLTKKDKPLRQCRDGKECFKRVMKGIDPVTLAECGVV